MMIKKRKKIMEKQEITTTSEFELGKRGIAWAVDKKRAASINYCEFV